MKRFALFILHVGFILLIVSFILTCIFEYDVFLHWVVNFIGMANKFDQILERIPTSIFILIRIVFVVCSLLVWLLIFYFEKIWSIFIFYFSYLQFCIRFLINQLIATPVKWILIIPFFSSVYFALVMPVSYDEAYTYLQFTSKSPILSFFYYPAPNNHVLHSLITNFTYYIPFCSDLFCLRISNIFFTFFTWLICFSFLKKYYSVNFSLVVTAIASMMFMSVYYSYMSRGYCLVMLFFIISLYAAFNIINNIKAKINWNVFSMSSILGFFTMPSYLYVWVIINTIIFLNSKHTIKEQFVNNCIILCNVLLLYTPIILINGMDALVRNKFVVPIDRTVVFSRLSDFFKTTVGEITGMYVIIILILLSISMFLIFKNRNRNEVVLTTIFIFLPVLLLIVHSVIPFPRTFNYYGFVFVFLIFLPFIKNLSVFPIHYLIIGCVLVQCGLFINFYSKINKYESFNTANHELNKKIVGKNRYFFNSSLFEVDFAFENQIRGFRLEKVMSLNAVNVDKDTLCGYDYYVIDKKNDCTKISKPVYSNATINVYAE
jgi:hypothetical protein